jgi:hypothetical protein
MATILGIHNFLKKLIAGSSKMEIAKPKKNHSAISLAR